MLQRCSIATSTTPPATTIGRTGVSSFIDLLSHRPTILQRAHDRPNHYALLPSKLPTPFTLRTPKALFIAILSRRSDRNTHYYEPKSDSSN